MNRPSAEPIIVCPLAFERGALARSGVGGRLMCIGPAEHGVERLRDMIEVPHGPVILAGVAGGLDDSCPAGSACIVSEVIGQDGARWVPPWRGTGDRHRAAKIATSREVLTMAQMKRGFANRTGAQMVDQESEPFARLASERGWTWGIVRGVSDDLSTTLPPDVHTWVTSDGRTRLMRVVLACLARPGRIGPLLALQRNSARAMAAVAEVLHSECEI